MSYFFLFLLRNLKIMNFTSKFYVVRVFPTALVDALLLCYDLLRMFQVDDYIVDALSAKDNSLRYYHYQPLQEKLLLPNESSTLASNLWKSIGVSWTQSHSEFETRGWFGNSMPVKKVFKTSITARNVLPWFWHRWLIG